ncbi:MAG: nuclear transport factor 2 family protein [Burkholderiaceae bacterium]
MPSTEHPPPIIGLMRRWVVDFFNCHDASVCRDILAPDYVLRIGDHTISGRDAQYIPAVQQQLDQFPGLGMTVHRVLVGQDQIALQFTEHGASGGAGGRVACWSGVALYRSHGLRLVGCVAQEDYMARQRQLKSGMADPIDRPAAAPWDEIAHAPDPQAEAVVRRWLHQSWPPSAKQMVCDDERVADMPPLAFEVTDAEVTDIFSSGAGVAFHVRQTGRYLGGLPGVVASGRAAVLYGAGIVTVVDGEVRPGRVIRDRAGLRRALLAG